jgi:hypothetical protein
VVKEGTLEIFKQGSAQVVRTAVTFHCILFNDLFIYATKLPSEKLKVEGVVHLASVRHMDKSPTASEIKAEDAVSDKILFSKCCSNGLILLQCCI